MIFFFSRTSIWMKTAVLLISLLGMAICHAKTTTPYQRLPQLLHNRYKRVARGGGIASSTSSNNNSPFVPPPPIGHDNDENDNAVYNDDNAVYNDDNAAYNDNEVVAPEEGEGEEEEPLNNWFSDPILERQERQTVQERVDAWRQQQQQLQQEQQQNELLQQQNSNNKNNNHHHQAQQQNLDNQGRMKLLTGVSKTSRAIIFFVLMWRNVHLYEVADQTFHGVLRLVVVIPLMGLFIANMAGVVTSLTSQYHHHTNKRLKAILNLDKAIEVVLVLYYLLRLTILPTASVPREIYIANTLHSVFFILQCQAFTRFSWDDAFANSHRPAPLAPPSSDLPPPPMNPYPSYNSLGDPTFSDDLSQDNDRSETTPNNYL